MHREVRDHLESLLDGNLLPAGRRELESHLRDCAGCRKQVEEAGLTSRWMRTLVSEPVMPAPGFYARVRARVDAERSQVWPFWQLMPAFSQQFAYALAMMLFLASSYFFTLRLTENQANIAEIMLDAPAIRTEAPPLTSDTHSNRERVMVALMAPLGRVEGD